MKIFYLLLLTSIAVAYQIPNNSINANALATANIANANGADASYYNPANIVHNDSINNIELGVNYIVLEPIDYISLDNTINISSKKQKNFIPSLHYTSSTLNNMGLRLGLCIVSPAGLTREWDAIPASATSRKYSLKTIELNPSLALPITPEISIALGLRFINASGQIILDGSFLPLNPPSSVPYTLDMEGDTNAFGYNLALSYKINRALNISLTYRSEINLELEGDGDATVGGTQITSKANVETPIPANLILACAYTFPTKTTVEVTYDKTFWSAVTETDFDFEDATLENILGTPKAKKWHDTVSYRLGLTQELNALTAMAGFSYSENASDEEYVSFASPESDTLTFSLGARYEIDANLEVGLSALLAKIEKRTSIQGTALGVNGELSARNIYALNFGVAYKF